MKAIFKGIVMGVVVAFIMVLPFLLAIAPDVIYKLSKDHSNMQTISLKVEDKYYKKYNENEGKIPFVFIILFFTLLQLNQNEQKHYTNRLGRHHQLYNQL